MCVGFCSAYFFTHAAYFPEIMGIPVRVYALLSSINNLSTFLDGTG